MAPEDSLETLGLSPAIIDRWFAQLSEPQRHYHTLDHITAMLRNVPDNAAHSRELIAAIWLHDIVYDPTAGDNEERSADQAARDLAGSDVGIEVVQRLIMGTKRHESAEHALDALMSDLDLLILSEIPAAYRTYAAQIRREYAHVPEDLYRAGRAQVMQKFLQAQIYQSERFAPREVLARENLLWEIAQLQGH